MYIITDDRLYDHNGNLLCSLNFDFDNNSVEIDVVYNRYTVIANIAMVNHFSSEVYEQFVAEIFEKYAAQLQFNRVFHSRIIEVFFNTMIKEMLVNYAV